MFRQVADPHYSEELAKALNLEREVYPAFAHSTMAFDARSAMAGRATIAGRPAIFCVVRKIPPDLRYVVASATRALWGGSGIIRLHDVDT